MAETVGNILLERLRRLPVRESNEVWELAVIAMPFAVESRPGGPEYEPLCAVCASSEGGMSATDLVAPADLKPSCLVEALASLALDPLVPGAEPLGYLPARVRISSPPPEIRARFEATMRDLGIVVEVKKALEHVQAAVESLKELGDLSESHYIDAPPLMASKGLTLEHVRSFADAAAKFWQAAPWRHFDDEVLWEIRPVPRTKGMRFCQVLGGGGMEFGFGFMSSVADFERMQTGDPFDLESSRPSGTIWSMTYESLVSAPEPDAMLWIEERLPLASPKALPLPMGVTEAGRVLRPDREQLRLMEALLRGFAEVKRAQLEDNAPVLNFRVPTLDCEMVLTLTKCD